MTDLFLRVKYTTGLFLPNKGRGVYIISNNSYGSPAVVDEIRRIVEYLELKQERIS